MTRKARSHDVLGKLSALSMAVILMLSAFVPMFASTVDAGAAASETANGTETFTIHLSSAADSYWSDSNGIQVRYLGSSGNKLGEGSITTLTTSNAVTVTPPSGTAKIAIDKLNNKGKLVTYINNTLKASTPKNQTLVLMDNTKDGVTQWAQGVWYYAWGGTPGKNAEWPGEPIPSENQITGTDVHYIYINPTDYPNIIFNNGDNGSQTGDLKTPTVGSNNIFYDPQSNDWVDYTAISIDRTVTLSVADRVEDGKNHIYITGEKTAAWSKYGDTIDLTTIYFKPSASWENAYVTYDEDDPYSTTVEMEKAYEPTAENRDIPLIFKAQVPVGAKLTFAGGTGSSVKHEVKNIYYNGDTSNNTYIQASTQWDTLEKALATASKNVDYPVTANNFSAAEPSISGGKVVGVKATYYDYLSNNELSQGWRQGLNDENFTDNYRKQFSTFNDLISSVASRDENWRYPLFFGDDYTAGYFIDGYYDTLSGSRNPGIDKSYFRAANNANFLPSGETNNMRSVLGLVQNSLSGGNLMVTPTTQAPWFNNDLLRPQTQEPETPTEHTPEAPTHLEPSGDAPVLNQYNRSDGNGAITTLANFSNAMMWSSDYGYYYYHVEKENKNSGHLYNIAYQGNTYYTVTANAYDNYINSSGYSGWNNIFDTGWGYTDFYIIFEPTDKVICPVSALGGSGTGGTGGTGGTTTQEDQYAKIIDSYFPFVATTDSNGVTTYSFDSANAKDNVYFNWDTTSGAPTQVNYGAGSSYGVKNKLSKDYGIFPFNKAGDTVRNYGFGIKMEMEFTLPMNGVYESSSAAPSVASDEIWIAQSANEKDDLQLYNSNENKYYKIVNENLYDRTEEYGGETYYVIKKTTVTEKDPGIDYLAWTGTTSWSNNIALDWGTAYAGDHSVVTGGVTNSKPAEFTYTGDDDLWVFVDGQLVLDLGGAHTPSTGSINFGAGENTVTSTASSVYAVLNAKDISATSGSSGTYSTDIVKDGASVTNTFTINNTDPTRKHTMTVFYMERGTNDSNLKVSYTIQPVQNDLTVNKEVSIPDINSGIASDVAAAVASSDFGFTMSCTPSGSDIAAAYDNKSYTQTAADGTKLSKTTNSSGGFTLRQNYSANFTKDLTYGDLISVNESVPGIFSYNTYYTVKDNKTDTALTYSQSKEAAFNLINKIGTDPNGDPDSGASVTVNYTNTLNVADLTLDKTLLEESGDESAKTVPFEYTVEIDLDGDGAAYSYQTYDLEYTLNGGTTKYTATDGKLSIRPDQTATFINIPVGAKYRITETVKAGYVIESISGATTTSGYVAEGTITDGGSGVLYKNKEKPASSGLQAQKTLDGNVYSGSDFSFSAELIRRDGGATIENAALKAMYATDGVSEKTTVDQNGYISFEDFTVIASSENKGKYVFKITESPTAADSPYNYDNTVYYAVIEVTEGSVGTPVYYTDVNLTSLVAADGKTAPTFANTTKGVDVQFTKVNESGNGMNGVEFKIYTDSNCTQQYTTNGVGDAIGTGGTVTSAKVNDADGVVKVEKMAYSTTAATTYYFKETKTLSGYQLLADPVVVTIATDGTYTVSYNGTTLTDNKVTNITQPELPSAGGVGVTMLYVLGAIAVIGAGTAFILYRKRINLLALAKQLIKRK